MGGAWQALLAGVVLLYVLYEIGGAAGCNWQQIDGGTIQIDAIPGGYRAVFMAGENCTISSEGPEVLPALDALLASLWCDWSIREGA